MKHKKLADLFVVFCFFAFLSAALYITVEGPKANWSYYENRLLTKWTAPTVQTVADGTYSANMESMLQDHAAGRNALLSLSTWLDLNVFHRPVVNQVVVTDDVLLHWLPYSTPDPDSIAAQAQNIAEQQAALRDAIASYGGEYYYAAVPGQYTAFEDAHPDYLNNRAELTELTLAAFKQAMAEQNVNVVDMGSMLEGADPARFYSRVDYHFTMGGAYETYLALMEAINASRDEALTVLEGDALRFETLENPYLGSRSRKVFGLWDCGEKTDVAWPAEPIPFTRTDNGGDTQATVYALPATAQDEVAYTVYMGGDVAETVIDTGRDELPSLLIYGDSFTNPVECLMYYSFDEMRTVDLRHYTEMSLADYIALHQPDYVICIRDYEQLLSAHANGDVF